MSAGSNVSSIYVIASFPDLPSNPLTRVDLRKFFVWFWMCTLTIKEGLQIAVWKPSLNSPLNSHLYSTDWISSLDSWSTVHLSSPYVSSSRVLCIVRTVFNWLNFKFGFMINCTSVFTLCIVISRFSALFEPCLNSRHILDLVRILCIRCTSVYGLSIPANWI